MGLIPGLGGSPGRKNGNPLQDSCQENPNDRGAQQATVQRVAVGWLLLSSRTSIFHLPLCLSVCISIHECLLSCVHLFEIPRTVAHQFPLSMEFSRQEYQSGLPFPFSGDLLGPGIKPVSLVSSALAGRFYTALPPGKISITTPVSISVSISALNRLRKKKYMFVLFF